MPASHASDRPVFGVVKSKAGLRIERLAVPGSKPDSGHLWFLRILFLYIKIGIAAPAGAFGAKIGEKHFFLKKI